MEERHWHGECDGPQNQLNTGKWKIDSLSRELVNLRNRLVHFRIMDIRFPEPAQVLAQLHGQDVLQGRVVDMSDSGDDARAFAVVEVEGLEQQVVVPARQLLGVL